MTVYQRFFLLPLILLGLFSSKFAESSQPKKGMMVSENCKNWLPESSSSAIKTRSKYLFMKPSVPPDDGENYVHLATSDDMSTLGSTTFISQEWGVSLGLYPVVEVFSENDLGKTIAIETWPKKLAYLMKKLPGNLSENMIQIVPLGKSSFELRVRTSNAMYLCKGPKECSIVSAKVQKKGSQPLSSFQELRAILEKSEALTRLKVLCNKDLSDTEDFKQKVKYFTDSCSYAPGIAEHIKASCLFYTSFVSTNWSDRRFK